MVAWDIHTESVAGTVDSAIGEVGNYLTDITTAGDAVTSVINALTNSQLVAKAVGDFAENVASPDLEAVWGHSNSAIRGTVDAVTAYLNGDHTMASTAQTNAASASYPEPPGAQAAPPRSATSH